MLLATQLPCPVLITDREGDIQFINQELLDLVGGDEHRWISKPIELLLPLPSRIFLQTHLWPMLLREGRVQEVRLQIVDRAGTRIPIFVNCKQIGEPGSIRYLWLLFVTLERSRYEQGLLEARHRAEQFSGELVKSERFIRTVADSMPGMIAYWDSNLQCQFVNKPYANWCEKEPDALIGMSMDTVVGSHYFQQNFPRIQGVLGGENQEFEKELVHQDGSMMWTQIHYVADKDAVGAVRGFFALITNITRLRQAAAAIRLTASVFAATTEAIIVTDTAGVIVSVNPAFSELTGYLVQEVVGSNVQMLRSDRHGNDFYTVMLSHLSENRFWKGEVWIRQKNGTVFLGQLALSAIVDEAGNAVQYVGVCSDITDRWNTEQKVRHMAFHDGLTGLPNRTLLMERLGQLIAITRREPRNLALLFLDLDGFKKVNDTWGHAVGDRVLMAIGTRLTDLLRVSDTVARLGGDEFVLLLDNPESRESVATVGDRIIAVVNEPLQLDAITMHVGTSIGIAIYQNQGESPDALLKRADNAMYAAKAAGKNVCVFAP